MIIYVVLECYDPQLLAQVQNVQMRCTKVWYASQGQLWILQLNSASFGSYLGMGQNPGT